METREPARPDEGAPLQASQYHLQRHGEVIVLRLEGSLDSVPDPAPYERDSRFLLSERLIVDLSAVDRLSPSAARRVVRSLSTRPGGSVRLVCGSAEVAESVRREAAGTRFRFHPDLPGAVRAFSAERSRVRVVEHPLFDRLDFELRTLLDVHKIGSQTEMILSFADPHSRSGAQIMLIYQPTRGVLKRLVHDPASNVNQESRLEVWKGIGREEIRQLAELAFLERTRPRSLEPEVLLGVLESLLEKGDFPSQEATGGATP